MVGYTGTLRVRRKEWTVVGLRAKSMPRSLWAIAIGYYACETKDSSTNGPGCKGSAAKGGTEIEELKRRDPMIETTTND